MKSALSRNSALFLAVFISLVFAAKPSFCDEDAAARERFMIGLNLVAPFTLMQNQVGGILPLWSNLEHGLSVNVGIFVDESLCVEGIFSYGPINALVANPQAHLGISYFPFQADAGNGASSAGFFISAHCRLYDYFVQTADIHYLSLIPYASVGYLFRFGPFGLDCRLHQSVAAYSICTAKGSIPGFNWFFSPLPELVPVMPFMSVRFSVFF